MAFDPVADLTSDNSLRVITNVDQNVRINVATGAVTVIRRSAPVR
jgi:hypothetical protein